MQLMKNKPLIIGVIVVIVLLIAGAIYFSVTNNSDSESVTDIQNNGQEENNTGADTDATDTDASTNTGADTDATDTDASTNTGADTDATDTDASTNTGAEDNGSTVLTEIGFDCQTTTIAAEAAVQVAKAQATAAENPDLVVLIQLYADLIGENDAADNEILNCNHAEQQLDVLVASNADANLHFMTRIQAVCSGTLSKGGILSPEGLELYLRELESDFEENPPLVIGSKVYFANGPGETQQKLRTLLQAESIEYAPAATPEFTCDA